jgi:hypothetical protein
MVRSTSFTFFSFVASEKALLVRCPFSVNRQSPPPYSLTSQVRVVQHKQTKELYALKYIKAKCVKMKAVANIMQERRLPEEVRLHSRCQPTAQLSPSLDRPPFVVNPRYAFQDDENCSFVLCLTLGGDLRFRLASFHDNRCLIRLPQSTLSA